MIDVLKLVTEETVSMVRSLEMPPGFLDAGMTLCGHNDMEMIFQFRESLVALTGLALCSLQTTTEKHRMSFPETVDEILDVSEDEGRAHRLVLK